MTIDDEIHLVEIYTAKIDDSVEVVGLSVLEPLQGWLEGGMGPLSDLLAESAQSVFFANAVEIVPHRQTECGVST